MAPGRKCWTYDTLDRKVADPVVRISEALEHGLDDAAKVGDNLLAEGDGRPGESEQAAVARGRRVLGRQEPT